MELRKLAFVVIIMLYLLMIKNTTLNLWRLLWWKLVPGVEFHVKWPMGEVKSMKPKIDIKNNNILVKPLSISADPNDHYRPWLEECVGRQGWDWDWKLSNNDVSKNRLTLKIRKDKKELATVAKMLWD